MEEKRIVIVGAGPAGISCAIQLKREGFDPLVIEKKQIGGLALEANLIENLLGFPNGVNGFKYANLMKKQSKKHNIKMLIDTVSYIEKNDSVFKIHCTSGKKLNAKFIVIATGVEPTKMISNDDNFFNYSILDIIEKPIGSDFKNVGIIGGGDVAFDYALNLSKYNVKSSIFIRNKIKAIPLLVDRAKKNNKIDIFLNNELENFTSVNNKISAYSSKLSKEFCFDNILVAIGRKNSKLYNLVKSLKPDNRLFFIGDCAHIDYRQISIAIGDGLKTATKIKDSILNAI